MRGLLSTSPSLLQFVPAHIFYPQRSCAVTSYAPAMMGSRASAGEFLYTNTITEARRVISTGKEETVLKNDTVVCIVTSLLQLFSL